VNRLTTIYKKLNDSEKYGLCFGLFPWHLEQYALTKNETVELIKIAQKHHKIEA